MIFRNLNANFKLKRRLLGQGQGHRDQNLTCNERRLIHGHVCAKYKRCTSKGIGVVNRSFDEFRNLNPNFETLTQTLGSRSRSQG